MFCWKNPKTKITIYGVSKHNMWFSTPSTYSSSYFSQNFVFNNPPLFFRTLSFSVVPSHTPMIKNDKNSKFKLTKFFDQSLF
jgi:hypothetical protein